MGKMGCAGLVFSLLLTVLFLNGKALGMQEAAQALGYESRLFDTGRVHTVDIVMDGWEGFLETCEDEEYAVCSVAIDGEAYKNVGLRAKGNTSLRSVSQLGSSRYSFKVEFDQYDSGKTYHGLDKLCLNNLIQDNTYMKDYLTYRLMGAFGVDSPLCSYAYVTVNGEDWGLYLAVEGVEDGFLQRQYGKGHGALYKPDSMSFGGGRGNGKGFDMAGFLGQEAGGQAAQGDSQAPGGSQQMRAGDRSPMPGMAGGGPGDMGSSDVKLQYIDDDPDSYPNIFDNAKTDVSAGDEQRLIDSLQSLSAYEDLEEALDVEEVLRYFVVHNFVVNGDSYTGSMIHNYYLYEQDGQLSMIPWDYNLAFGTFQAGDAGSAVNDPVDEVLEDRPMQAWIFSDEAYTARYHALYGEFLDSIDIEGIVEDAYSLIAPYVEKDPTKFCTYEEFEAGIQALQGFCSLREESVRGQLDGSIPSNQAGQREDSQALVDAAGLSLSDMGSMGQGSMPEFGQGDMPEVGQGDMPEVGQGDMPEFGQGDMPEFGQGDMPEVGQGDMPEVGQGDMPEFGQGDMPEFGQEDAGSSEGQALLLLGISGLALAAGILVAKMFRH